MTNCLTLVLAKISQILNWFQILNLPWELHKIVVIILLLLLVFNMLEVCCYAILFHHIYHHDNNIAILILNPDVIRGPKHQKCYFISRPIIKLDPWSILCSFESVFYFIGLSGAFARIGILFKTVWIYSHSSCSNFLFSSP